MKYNILGGGQLEATSDFEIVEGLRQVAMAWAPTVSIEDFMVEMADRCKTYKGVFVRTDYIPNFVSDLRQYGFIEAVSPTS
ncbi:MAG: hypothetical protein ACRYFK_07405 [Janthinobacterium lividum]